jgi:hypothetical protein
MENIEILLAIEEIKALKARYFLALDGKDAGAYAATFCNDGVFDIGRYDINGIAAGTSAAGPVLKGRKVIADFVLGSLSGVQSSHRAFNPLIEILSPTEAKATWSMEDWLRPLGEGEKVRLAGFGYYRDSYVKRNGAWLIAHSILERWT